MGVCCSSSKAVSTPEKKNEMVKSENQVKTPVVECNPTHNVLAPLDKTSLVSEGNSEKIPDSSSSSSNAVETPSPAKVSNPALPPLSPNKTKSNLTVNTDSTDQSEPSPSSSTRNSETGSGFLNRSSSSRPRVLSADVSSRSSFTSTKKDNREFRLFLPFIEETDEHWIPAELASAYRSALEAFQAAFSEGEDIVTEWKDDTFIAGRPYFSLRYLEDKKLEMRVKTENTPIWMEKWSKVRFGKKAIGHYKADIVSYLHDVGHKDPTIEKIIDEPHLLVIRRREINTPPEMGVELALIEVPESQKETVNDEVSDSVSRSKRRWLTFCMAADSTKIQEFILSRHYNNNSTTTAAGSLWSVVQLGSDIFDCNNEAAIDHSFIPLMSGYALWVRLVLNKFGTSEAWKDEMVPPLDSFLLYLKGDTP